MESEKRRKKILNTIQSSQAPISGTQLAKFCGVSRQVIVQDIALLKASGEEIISTVRGYHCLKEKDIQKYIHVEHGREQMEEELNTIVDNGGYIVNTGIDHPTYGKIHVDMNISSRKDVKAFIQKSYENDFSPLSTHLREALPFGGNTVHGRYAGNRRCLGGIGDSPKVGFSYEGFLWRPMSK